ncbi:MAG: hypothetical protein KDK62_04735, partial [Chlamydiia bacterium]|nr:hypothetical protein [Chlamydiia bacterium]
MVIRYTQLYKLGVDPSITCGSLQKRCEVTGYPKSMVIALESNLNSLLSQPPGASPQSMVNGFVINRFKGEKGGATVLIHEHFLGAGTFKEVRAASDYFAMRSSAQRRALADARPRDANTLEPTYTQSDFETETYITVEDSDLIFSTPQQVESESDLSSSPSDEQLGTFVQHAPGEESPAGTVV